MKAMLSAFLAAVFYAINIPASKVLLQDVGPTTMAALLYLGAGIGIAARSFFNVHDRKASAPLMMRRFHGANQHYVAYGAVGSLIVSIEYAEPRYALREGKCELVFKGGVKFSASRAGWIK